MCLDVSLPTHWMKCVSAQGEYFEGTHLAVEPEQFGIEDEENEDSDTNSDSDGSPSQYLSWCFELNFEYFIFRHFCISSCGCMDFHVQGSH